MVKDWISTTLPKDGAVVESVVNGSPAFQLGIHEEDIITIWNGNKITNAKDFENALVASIVGKSYTIGVVRNIQQGKHRGNKFSQAKLVPVVAPILSKEDILDVNDPIAVAIRKHRIIKGMTETQIKLAMKYPGWKNNLCWNASCGTTDNGEGDVIEDWHVRLQWINIIPGSRGNSECEVRTMEVHIKDGIVQRVITQESEEGKSYHQMEPGN